MAEVFSGYVIGSHGFQKPVAIKRLLPELANDHVFVERLIGEAKLLVGMQHGNIVSVMDLARDGDDVFLVMEFVDGPSLRQLLKGRGKRLLPLGVASYIVQSAAAGLELAHARGIIHADISPSNLLLTTSGEVRVADFGIARREGGLVGVVEGKWAYMAPEQARGESLTARSDVFALGVVLYELITGQHPLGSKISAEERDSGPIRVILPRLVNPAVPPGLEAICVRALAENARERYPSMQSMIDAIMDERFTNQWREGANDLAIAIREIVPRTPGAASARPRTQVTDRPVTIVTRSLISQSHRGASAAEVASQSASVPTGQLGVGDSTKVITKPGAARGSAPLLPPSGGQTLQVQLTPSMLPQLTPHPELASVHGGATITGSSAIDLRDARGGRKWTVAVLGLAAVLGIGAAIAIQLAPSEQLAQAEAAAPIAAERAEAQVEPPVAAPVAEPVAEPAAQPTVPAVEPTVAPVAPSEVAPAPVKPAAAPVAKRAKVVKRTAAAPAAGGEAILRVSTYGAVWANVVINGERQEVPNAKFKLAPGTYKVVLKNTDLAITRTCTVALEAGQVRSLKVEMEEGGCDLLR